MRISVVYDNEALDGFCSGWAFSCLVEAHGKKLLFDTGWSGTQLVSNMAKLGVAPKSIDAIFISHDHWDHAGGLAYLLGVTGNIPVFVPCSFSTHLKEEIGKLSKLVEVSDAVEMLPGLFSTGELGSIVKEQSLVVKTDKGNIVVCGCSHPGVENILQKARSFGEVYGIIGGLHGFDNLEALGQLKLLVPCHCTQKKKEIMERFPDASKECKAGTAIEI